MPDGVCPDLNNIGRTKTPSGESRMGFFVFGGVAPMVERRAEDPCVGGSSPSLTTRSNAAVVQLVEQVLAGVMI